MSDIVIRVENLSKRYRLGQIGTGTFSRDLEVWWAKLRGAWRPIPLLRHLRSAQGAESAKLTTLDGYGIIVRMESEK
jgi:lipopolysaccharide transport system ATP-binding protein